MSATTAGYFDLKWHRVPNWLVGLTMVLALTWHAAVAGLTGLWSSLTGLLLGTGLLFPLFLLRGMGAVVLRRGSARETMRNLADLAISCKGGSSRTR